MRRHLQLAFCALLAALLFQNCQRDVQTPDDFSNNNNSGNNSSTVTAGMRGTVVDENSQPVAGASISSGILTTTTDLYGNFSFKDLAMTRSTGIVTVTRTGYFQTTRSFAASAGRIHNIRIRLIPRRNSGTFSGTTGGTVSLSSGAKLVMPSNAITDANGNAYNGTVNVAMTYIDPTSPESSETMPGDLRGITATGAERALESFGMMGVELTDAANMPLKLASGKTAQLTFPIHGTIIGNAPATIDLWYFDNSSGKWKQEGTATRSGSNYVGNVSHFSFWNCDYAIPTALVDLTATLLYSTNNLPLVNARVRIKRANSTGGFGWGFTDSIGFLNARVPVNEALSLEVMNQCNNVVSTHAIGPYSSSSNLGNLSVNLPTLSALTVTGNITNCSNAPLTNGSVLLVADGGHSYRVPVTNGSFSQTIIHCSNATVNYSLVALDLGTQQESGVIGGSGNAGTVNVGTIQACGNSSQQFFEYIIDGVPYNNLPSDVFIFSDGAGDPTFSHQTILSVMRPGIGMAFSIMMFDNEVTGVYPLRVIQSRYQINPDKYLRLINNTYPNVTITEFGPRVVGYFAGNITALMDVDGVPKQVTVRFRARRI